MGYDFESVFPLTMCMATGQILYTILIWVFLYTGKPVLTII